MQVQLLRLSVRKARQSYRRHESECGKIAENVRWEANHCCRMWVVKSLEGNPNVGLDESTVQAQASTFGPGKALMPLVRVPCPSKAPAGGANQGERKPRAYKAAHLSVIPIPLRRQPWSQSLSSSDSFPAFHSVNRVDQWSEVFVHRQTRFTILILFLPLLPAKNLGWVKAPVGSCVGVGYSNVKYRSCAMRPKAMSRNVTSQSTSVSQYTLRCCVDHRDFGFVRYSWGSECCN